MPDSHAAFAERLLKSGMQADIAAAQVAALLHIGDAVNRLAEQIAAGRRSPIPVKPTWRDVSS